LVVAVKRIAQSVAEGIHETFAILADALALRQREGRQRTLHRVYLLRRNIGETILTRFR
jgi:uncharacterized protein YoaH (UPF0181 family)